MTKACVIAIAAIATKNTARGRRVSALGGEESKRSHTHDQARLKSQSDELLYERRLGELLASFPDQLVDQNGGAHDRIGEVELDIL